MNDIQSFRKDFCKYISSDNRKIMVQTDMFTHSNLIIICMANIRYQLSQYIRHRPRPNYYPMVGECDDIVEDFAINLRDEMFSVPE